MKYFNKQNFMVQESIKKIMLMSDRSDFQSQFLIDLVDSARISRYLRFGKMQ